MPDTQTDFRVPSIPELDAVEPTRTAKHTRTYTVPKDEHRAVQASCKDEPPHTNDSLFTRVLHAPKGNRSEKRARIRFENTGTGESLHGFIDHVTLPTGRIHLSTSDDRHATVDALPGSRCVLVTREAKSLSRIPEQKFYCDTAHVTEYIIEYRAPEITDVIETKRGTPGNTPFPSDVRNIDVDRAFTAAPYNRGVSENTLSHDVLVFESIAALSPSEVKTVTLQCLSGAEIRGVRPPGPFYDTRLEIEKAVVTRGDSDTSSDGDGEGVGCVTVEHLHGSSLAVARTGSEAFIVNGLSYTVNSNG